MHLFVSKKFERTHDNSPYSETDFICQIPVIQKNADLVQNATLDTTKHQNVFAILAKVIPTISRSAAAMAKRTLRIVILEHLHVRKEDTSLPLRICHVVS